MKKSNCNMKIKKEVIKKTEDIIKTNNYVLYDLI